ncbi:MAG TPA: hypothetical protein PKD55_01355 [Bellilinea sp.]|nr:hypothetical protein [Bellilinea sp.]
MKIDIWFDGGSLNNQGKDRSGYGSFVTMNGGKKVTMTIDRGTPTERKMDQCRIEYGNITNNDAEWRTLIVALTYATQLQQATKTPLEFHIHGNVLGPFLNGSKVKAEHLKVHYEKVKDLLQYVTVEFVKEPDTKVKQVLGH